MSTIIAEHPNAALVRRGYEAFNTADMETLTEFFDESASWHTPGRSPLAGDRVGRDAVFAQFGQYGGQTGGTFRATLQHVLTDDDGRVIGIHHNTAERNGKKLDVYCCIVFEIKDGVCFRSGALLRPLRVGRVLVVAPPARARQVTLTANAEGALNECRNPRNCGGFVGWRLTTRSGRSPMPCH